MNSTIFRAGTEQIPAPTLRPGRHRRHGQSQQPQEPALAKAGVAGIREAVEARGATLLYLPPHSPDLDPIGQAFAKLEALLRKAARRTVDGPWSTIAASLDRFAPAECANYLANSGYPRSA